MKNIKKLSGKRFPLISGRLYNRKILIIACAVIITLGFAACGDKKTGGPGLLDSNYYTVLFDNDGGWPVTNHQIVEKDGKAEKPNDPEKAIAGLHRGGSVASVFRGWFHEGSEWDFESDFVTGNITLTAEWEDPSPVYLDGTEGDNIIEKAIKYIGTEEDPEDYTLVLDKSVDIRGLVLNEGNVKLTIMGLYEEKTISLSAGQSDALFALGNNAALTLGENITLRGKENNSDAVVTLNSASAGFRMLPGSKITGNSIDISGNTSTHQINTAAAVEIINGVMTMEGGEITGNRSDKAGGKEISAYHYGHYATSGAVTVYSNGVFTMEGGSITGNKGGVAELVYVVDSNPNPGGSFFLSGDAAVGSIALLAESKKPVKHITVASAWNPESNVTLHLSGGNNYMDTVSDRFDSQRLVDVDSLSGSAGPEAIGRFTLGIFCTHTQATNDKPNISKTHKISAAGSSIGKLVQN